ncbi:MAG: ATP-binding protein [Sulfurifustis sp.]
MSSAKKQRPPKKPTAPIDDAIALADALGALDRVLTIAVERQARALGPATLLDPWRGMHLEPADVQRLLKDERFAAFFTADDGGVADLLACALRRFSRAARLAAGFRLTNVDLAALLIVLAPDLDLRYERIYGYLHDDIARKRPTLDLIANLLARSAAERVVVCSRFHSAAPLLRAGVFLAQSGADTPALARAWRVDELWRQWLLGDADVAAYVGECARLVTPPRTDLDQLPLEPATRALLRHAARAAPPLRLLLHGPHGAGKYALAQALACERGERLLVLDLRDASELAELRLLLRRARSAATLFRAMVYVHGVARLEQRDPQLLRVLFEMLGASACDAVLACTAPLPPVHAAALPLLRVELGYPSASLRRAVWRRALAARDMPLDEESEARIATRFSLSVAQIEQAAAEAHALALAADTARIGYRELAAAVRRQCGTELARMAQRITPRADFDSLVVPAEVQAQLREICARVATRDTVGREWAEGSVHARATGVTALFVGSSGTGKTLSAEALARELGLDLYRIDLAGIVSKYIGETEKNLDRVFAAAENANAVLFFDEADALFGKRSEVKDAHDRYANIEIAYLLQKMEQFDGLAILATNLKQNLDEAFSRRLTFTVNFPFPEEPERVRLWEKLWPPRAPRGDDVDLAWFAREYRLSGGNIRNTVLAAAHLAAADGTAITREHLLRATRREYQKLGKNLVHPVAGERRAV